MKKAVFVFCCLLTFHSSSIFAQQDSIPSKKDSILNVQLDNQQKRLRQISAQQLVDSLKRVNLQNQVADLKSEDKLKREELLKQLNRLQHTDSLHKAEQKHQIDSLRKFVKGFPVIPFRDTLFNLFTRQGSFTAQERAEAISKRIVQFGRTYNYSADSLKIVTTEQTTDIVFRDQLLISISDQDALWQNSTRNKLAAALKATINTAIFKHKDETRWQTIIKESMLALLVLFVVVMLIYSINRAFRWTLKKLKTQQTWFTKGIQINKYELLDAERQVYVITGGIKLIKWILIVVVVYLALPVLFGIFPFTRDLSDLLISYITTPLKKVGISLWHYIPNLMTILVLVVIFRLVLRFINYIRAEIEEERLTIPGFYADWANPTYQIVRILILAFMLIVIFPYLPGSDSAVFKGVSVFVGVLFTFGSAGALSNIVAGLVMTYMRAFKIGDRVKIGEVTGDIIEKTILVTRIRTIQNEIVSIPNSTVMGTHTLNYSTDAPLNGLIIHTTVTIGFDAPWRQVHQLLIDAALNTPMIDKTPAPYVYQLSLDDFYVSYRINAYTHEPNKQAAVYSSLHANIQDEFNKAGVEIMSPHYKALRDGNNVAIPPDYLPKDYVSPAFQTQQRKQE